jgi:hypothetical protein
MYKNDKNKISTDIFVVIDDFFPLIFTGDDICYQATSLILP